MSVWTIHLGVIRYSTNRASLDRESQPVQSSQLRQTCKDLSRSLGTSNKISRCIELCQVLGIQGISLPCHSSRNVIHEHFFLDCKLEAVVRHTEVLVRVWLLFTVPHAELLETDRLRKSSTRNVLGMIPSYSIISWSNITRVRVGSDDEDYETCFLSDTYIVGQILIDASNCPQLCAPDAPKSLSE